MFEHRDRLNVQFWLGSAPPSISTLGVLHKRRPGWAIMAWNGYSGFRSSRDACGAATWFMERNLRRLCCLNYWV